MEVGYTSEEFTSAFETRENTVKFDQIHGFQQRLEGVCPTVVHWPLFKSYRFPDILAVRLWTAFL